jgi:hypothetical protein
MPKKLVTFLAFEKSSNPDNTLIIMVFTLIPMPGIVFNSLYLSENSFAKIPFISFSNLDIVVFMYETRCL